MSKSASCDRENRQLFTLFGHLLPLAGLVAGATLGLLMGLSRGGFFGAVLGLAGGAVLGLICGSLPGAILRAILLFQLRRKTSGELRTSLRNGECRLVNLATSELRRRGEIVQDDIDFVLDMLVSIHHDDRCRGWAAMLTAFPELAAEIADYSPINPLEESRALVGRLRQSAVVSLPLGNRAGEA
jgi:hypothetical protein